MPQTNRIAPFALTVIIAVILQILFIFSDMQDTPARAATEFTRAYFKADKAMAERLCDESRMMNGVDVIDEYIYQKKQEAADRGYGMFYMSDSVYNLRTYVISRDDAAVELRVTGKAKPILKSFFTGEDAKQIDEVIRLVNENGKWKVCGKVFSLASL